MSIAERISVFNFIRDIPYRIGLTSDMQDYCCSTKSVMLAKLLNQLGLETRQIICTFDWTETPLPQTILSLPREKGETHQFTQVFLPETNAWVTCDATWDKDLNGTGLDIATWDGLHDTAIAVKPHVIYSAEESARLIKSYEDPDMIKSHFDYHYDFYAAINKWLAQHRPTHTST